MKSLSLLCTITLDRVQLKLAGYQGTIATKLRSLDDDTIEADPSALII